ncbi:MAG: SLC13/DASS family transporter [Euryarchaeota archaeon]|nr:SLC13/DASS family transporter [Euryarchaeota archaeon]
MIKKKNLYLLIAILVLVIFYFIPTPAGLTYQGKMMLGVLVFGAILFVTEAIPLGMAGLAVMVAPILLSISTPKEVFALFGNSAVFFLIGAFIIAAGFQKSGLHERIAIRILKRVGDSPKKFILAIMLLAGGLSLIMSEHGVAALLLPIVAYSLMKIPESSNLRKGGMIGLAYGCSIGSIGTLLGCGRNPYTVMYLQQTAGIYISFTQWIMLAMPVVALMLPIGWLWLTHLYPPEKNTKIPVLSVPEKKLSASEKKVAIILIFTVLALIFIRNWGVAVVVLLGALAMFVGGVIDWKDVERTLPWGIILLYGGAITLGAGLYKTGASDWLASNIIKFTGTNPYVLLFLLIAITILITEFMSNTAAVALMLPIGAGLASVVSGLNVVVTSVAIALAGGFAFMFVIGTPGNLITYSTGFYSSKDLLKTGAVLDVIGMVVIFLIAVTLWPLMGVW